MTKITLIESADREPTIKVKPGVTIEQVEVSVSDEKGNSKPLATLCGYDATYCVALIEQS
ncbi:MULTISPECIES: hypothetical protein [Mesorhizobium]|uniref:hypothetical protein n=1 Tax=Mesorhizobium TaxID=68287 RepID=UPI0007EDAEE2|nr:MULTISPECIES: hypothetical protein [Mesorhizobium]TPJ40407.1 hypothetical protein FJ437_26225 [Mesorhizobium sp. B2-6-6]ARP67210.1 hypothetical protein A9K65_030605 [Mesorhizobium sp. WSM1497]MCA0002796.1 hypothetical protein [Mesorhizobium sp. B264B2A]MCA0009053.1 hypothetical protein [Mesorhizobium sp. B264B1B]MCA0014550.1 hypothetical protein [Mesorhizobium sp. B294B1A1]